MYPAPMALQPTYSAPTARQRRRSPPRHSRRGVNHSQCLVISRRESDRPSTAPFGRPARCRDPSEPCARHPARKTSKAQGGRKVQVAAQAVAADLESTRRGQSTTSEARQNATSQPLITNLCVNLPARPCGPRERPPPQRAGEAPRPSSGSCNCPAIAARRSAARASSPALTRKQSSM
jgi:hypothetical protein